MKFLFPARILIGSSRCVVNAGYERGAMTELGKALIVLGGVILLVGVLLTVGGRVPWLGRLPGG